MKLPSEKKLWSWQIFWTGWGFDVFVRRSLATVGCWVKYRFMLLLFFFKSSITRCWTSVWCWWAWWFLRTAIRSALKDLQATCWGGLWRGGRRRCCPRSDTTSASSLCKRRMLIESWRRRTQIWWPVSFCSALLRSLRGKPESYGGVLGMAFVGTVCSASTSGGISVVSCSAF